MTLKHETFKALVETGDLKVDTNGKYNLYQYMNMWADWTNPTIKASRGIVFNDKGDIVVRPYEKFFNYHQFNWVLSEHTDELTGRMTLEQKRKTKAMCEWIDDVPVKVEEKLDGSLMNVSAHQGELIMTSSGSVKGKYPQFFKDMLNQKLNDSQLQLLTEVLEGKTAIFEYINPVVDSHVVNYTYQDIVLHGLIDNRTGYDYAFDTNIDELASQFSFKRPYLYDVSTEEGVLALIDAMEDEDVEGIVVTFNLGHGRVHRLKFKTQRYINLHAIMYTLGGNQVTYKGVMETYKKIENDDIDDMLNKLEDKPFALARVNAIKARFNEINDIKNDLLSYIKLTESTYDMSIEDILEDDKLRGIVIKDLKERVQEKRNLSMYIRLLTNHYDTDLKTGIETFKYYETFDIMFRNEMRHLRDKIIKEVK